MEEKIRLNMNKEVEKVFNIIEDYRKTKYKSIVNMIEKNFGRILYKQFLYSDEKFNVNIDTEFAIFDIIDYCGVFHSKEIKIMSKSNDRLIMQVDNEFANWLTGYGHESRIESNAILTFDENIELINKIYFDEEKNVILERRYKNLNNIGNGLILSEENNREKTREIRIE